MNDLSFVQLILNASLPVQAVMLLLVFISLFSWTLILVKSRSLTRAHRAADRFEEHFLNTKDLNVLYTHVNSGRHEPRGIENIFSSGYTEFAKLRKQQKIALMALLDGVQRAMRIVLRRELDSLETHLASLATIGSVSPYIGLFGTVWGIMGSFHALGQMEHVTLAVVAPGISEALIATAMGLFAAIPAVIAYNQYVDEVDRLATRYDAFLDEFIGIIQRQHALLTPADIVAD